LLGKKELEIRLVTEDLDFYYPERGPLAQYKRVLAARGVVDMDRIYQLLGMSKKTCDQSQEPQERLCEQYQAFRYALSRLITKHPSSDSLIS